MNCRTNYPVKRALVAMENESLIDMDDETTKYCVSWVTRQVVEIGLNYAVGSWNSHPTPGKRLADCLMCAIVRTNIVTYILFVSTGKGVPQERARENNHTHTISPHLLPTVEAATEMYRSSGGEIQINSCFGTDPSESCHLKAAARDKQFLNYFNFSEMFHEVSNGKIELFKNGLLYYIRLTKHNP